MKELDVLLEGYLEQSYPHAAESRQQAFRQLLEMPDPTLFAYLTGREEPANEEQRRVVESLRRTAGR